ncbi:tRNA-specific 2-thiouridylase mnmA [Termitomyces sp. J132]|nr:hypothetical protein H2248_001076 [Termitomyces sp. 'cryptogamus']KNZ74149.1 tRNA-specific 2-thiouridylase mnmA [Termitomyces sp. J132]
MSGGVDSSVTAKLLADQDYDLSAVYMRNWDTRDESGTDKGCEWEKDWEDVQRVCTLLDIPCQMIDLSREYWNRVFEPSLRQWEDGVTPNPDVWCNKEIKFGALLEHLPTSSNLSSKTWFATGHYARKRWSKDPWNFKLHRPQLLRAADTIKDQTYFLAGISEDGLSRALFPLGDLLKSQVREIAKHHHLPTAERKESMGICFVGKKGKFGDFISSYIPPNPGPMIDLSTGSTVATHQGLWNYTIGQGARISGMKEKAFVVRKDIERNTIYIAPGADNPLLRCSTVHVTTFSFIWADAPPAGLHEPTGYRSHVKLMHKMKSVMCYIFGSPGTDEVTIKFDDSMSGISPGQVAVIYDTGGEWCLGCGVITDTVPLDEEIPCS